MKNDLGEIIWKRLMNRAILFFILFIFNCGYYSMKGSLPAHIGSISIAPVINQSAEFGAADELERNITDLFISENVLELTGDETADSQLKLIVLSVLDKPFTFLVAESSQYEQVDEWRITVKVNVVWYDITKDEPLIKKDVSAWGAYGTGVDISSDGIDNDNDGLIDEDDDDEFGSPRMSALNIAINKLSEDILSDITSTW